MERNMSKEAETYLRECLFGYEPPYYLSADTIKKVSDNFLREWRNVITWDYDSKKFVKITHNEKFYNELFGE